jgi:hypothetical protein
MAKNPEQNNNQDQGPPDLDEFLNDLGEKKALKRIPSRIMEAHNPKCLKINYR